MIGINYHRSHHRETNHSNWPKTQINIEKACTELFALHGQFEYRRGEPTRKAKKVYKSVGVIAEKYGLTYQHLFNVYFGMI